MSRPRFFVPDIADAAAPVALPPDEAHHLMHVLRLGPGAEIAVFDGRGHEWTARVVKAGKRSDVVVELEQAAATVAEPPVKVTLAVGLLKGDQMDAVVRDATMLGVSAILPLISEHVVVPARAWKTTSVLARWQRVAVASAKQCGRSVVPGVKPPEHFDSAIGRSDEGRRLMCVEPAQARLTANAVSADNRPATAIAFVGPEGGWAASEIDRADRLGVQLIHLGPRTLRAETAPTVLLSALWTVWGWQ